MCVNVPHDLSEMLMQTSSYMGRWLNCANTVKFIKCT